MKAIARAKTWYRVLAASVALTAVCGFSETPDYFVEWVQPSAALHVDTGVRGKVGVKAEVQFIHRSSPTFPVLLGFWGGNKKRFNLVMHWNEQGRWEYGDQMNNLGGFPWYGLLTTVSVEVPANGAMSCTWTNTEGGSMNHTMNATATYGLLDTETTLTLFASHYKDASSESFNQPHLGRLYYCKLWEGDTGAWTLSRDFRPCVKDGVAGLYDSVEGVIHYPAGNVLVAGPVAYDTIATWNGGTTPTAAELATASNWTCTDKNGDSVASAVPDKATLVVFPAGIGSVTLPDGYIAPWGAVRADGSVAHPATQYGTYTKGRDFVIIPAYGYTVVGEGSLSDLVKVNGATSALNYAGKQVRHDGWFYVNAAQAGTWKMNQDVDDYYAFFIDDVEVFGNHTYNPGVNNVACTVTEGWHRFTSIVDDTGGGWGMEYKFGNDYVPFTITVNGNTYVISDDTTFPKGSGASVITLTADVNWSALGKVALQGGARIDLNGHSLVVDDILADDYIGTVITNSAAKKSVLYFLGDPLESKAYAVGIIKEANEKIILAHDGDQVATWTGAANDGNPATAGNQIPAGSTFVCKSFEIGNCTFTADCDWRGLSVKPTIVGTANLNGHNLNIKRLSASSGSEFANSVAGTVSEVRFDVESGADVFGEEWYIENAANLKTAENARIVLVKGASDISANVLKIGDASGIYADFVQTDGAVTMGNSAESRIGGWSSGNKGHGTYTMYGGSLTVGSSLHVGGYGTGEFTQHGGTVTLNSFFAVGRFGGSTGTYVITNGTLTVKNETEIGMDGGTDRFDICGDARVDLKSLVMPIERGNANLRIADNASLTMTGLTIGRGYGTSDTKGYFTQDGGTVPAG